MILISKKTGIERPVSPERWRRIQDNGKAHLFTVKPEPEPPAEIGQHLEQGGQSEAENVTSDDLEPITKTAATNTKKKKQNVPPVGA